MADCSSSIGFSNIGILQNEVISRKKLVFGSVGFRNSVKEASLPVFSVKVSFRHVNVRRKQNIVVMRTMPPYDRSLSGVAADTNQEDEGKRTVGKETKGVVSEYEQKIDGGGGGGDGDGGLDGDVDVLDGSGGNGKPPNGEGGGGGGDNGGDENGGDKEEGEFGRVLSYGEVMREVEASGASLPSDMLEAAKSVGIHELLLRRYLDLQGAAWPLGFGMKSCSMLRNRMLADPSFLFKVGAEIVIDSVCATLAEVQKRGKDFWAEFELYTADLLVGVAVNVALVGMLAPYVRFGQPSLSNGLLGRWQNACAALPSSVFEAERLGQTFSVQQRIATYFYKGILYAAVGFGCGIVGQGITNLIMIAKRRVKKSEDDIPVPPLVKSAALWGVFLGVSSNTRYQVINGLERVVEGSPLAKQFPPVALAFTVGVRLTNNIFGAMQFVDWAKWSGCQ